MFQGCDKLKIKKLPEDNYESSIINNYTGSDNQNNKDDNKDVKEDESYKINANIKDNKDGNGCLGHCLII